jgi:toxin ParE1/3/4
LSSVARSVHGHFYSGCESGTDRSTDWYEGEAGLGRRFREGIDVLAERMSANPRQLPVMFKNVRRSLLHRFPYALFFVVEDDTLLVIACFHASRDPLQWQKRT